MNNVKGLIKLYKKFTGENYVGRNTKYNVLKALYKHFNGTDYTGSPNTGAVLDGIGDTLINMNEPEVRNFELKPVFANRSYALGTKENGLSLVVQSDGAKAHFEHSLGFYGYNTSGYYVECKYCAGGYENFEDIPTTAEGIYDDYVNGTKTYNNYNSFNISADALSGKEFEKVHGYIPCYMYTIRNDFAISSSTGVKTVVVMYLLKDAEGNVKAYDCYAINKWKNFYDVTPQ